MPRVKDLPSGFLGVIRLTFPGDITLPFNVAHTSKNLSCLKIEINPKETDINLETKVIFKINSCGEFMRKW